MRRLMMLAAAAVLAASAGTAATWTPAQAASCPSGETCGVAGYNGNGDAMNAWFGGPNVYAYANGKSTNENFLDSTVDRCGGGDKVTSTCPFTLHSDDSSLLGKRIVQVIYAGGTGSCVGSSDPTQDADLVGCNDPETGTGGGVDTVMVVAGNNTLVSVGCTNGNSGVWCQLDQGPGSATDFFQGLSNATEWANL